MSSLLAMGLSLALSITGGASFVANDVIRSGDKISASNISTEAGETAPSNDPLIGREVRRTIYAGQPVSMDNTRPARLVSRNQMVTVKYIRGGLEISTTGRAMGEAAADEPVTVLNTDSRQMVHGIVQKDGWVLAQ